MALKPLTTINMYSFSAAAAQDEVFGGNCEVVHHRDDENNNVELFLPRKYGGCVCCIVVQAWRIDESDVHHLFIAQ